MSTQNPTYTQLLVSPQVPLDGLLGNTAQARLDCLIPTRLSCRLADGPSARFALPFDRELSLDERRRLAHQTSSPRPNRDSESERCEVECVCAHSACTRRKYFHFPADALDLDGKALPACQRREINGAYVSPERQIFCSLACYCDECAD